MLIMGTALVTAVLVERLCWVNGIRSRIFLCTSFASAGSLRAKLSRNVASPIAIRHSLLAKVRRLLAKMSYAGWGQRWYIVR
jgi:hypothetical protein